MNNEDPRAAFGTNREPQDKRTESEKIDDAKTILNKQFSRNNFGKDPRGKDEENRNAKTDDRATKPI